MSTTPPPEERPRSGTPYPWTTMPDVARLPIPGNAELLVWLLALIIAMFVVWIADSMSSPTWFDFFKWTTIAYILSRGIAKASRVLEQ